MRYLWKRLVKSMTRLKQSLAGTGKVFSFSFIEFMKSRSNIVSLIILMVFALASVPVGTLAAGGTFSKSDVSQAGTVYINNESGLDLAAENIAEADPYFSVTAFTAAWMTADGFRSSAGENDVYASVSADGGAYSVLLTLPDGSVLPEEDISRLSELLTEQVHLARCAALGLGVEETGLLSASVDYSVSTAEDYLHSNENSWAAQYWIQLIYAIVVMVVSIFSVSYIVRAVVEEKASKLVELLMVSVKPLALILGKILASMLYVFVSFAVLIVCFILSYKVSGLFLDVSAISSYLAGMGISSELLNVGPATVAIVLISLLLGYLTFAILAGLSGTGCSAMEEMQDAIGGSTMLIMAGYIVSIFVSSFGSRTLSTVCSLIPVLSVFCAPAQYVTGNISLALLCVSWLIQAVFIVLLALFCAKVYSSLLIHRGSRVKLKQMLAMAKGYGNGKEAV